MCHVANWVTLGKSPYTTPANTYKLWPALIPQTSTEHLLRAKCRWSLQTRPSHAKNTLITSAVVLPSLNLPLPEIFSFADLLPQEKVSSMMPGDLSLSHSLSLQCQAHTYYTVTQHVFKGLGKSDVVPTAP